MSLLLLAMSACRGPSGRYKPSAERQAWVTLQSWHTAAVKKELSTLPHSERKRVEAFYAERGKRPWTLETPLTAAGTPAGVLAPGFRVTGPDVGLPQGTAPMDLGRTVLRRLAPIWQVPRRSLDEAETRITTGSHGQTPAAIDYYQRIDGLPVVDGRITVHFDQRRGDVIGIAGAFAPVRPGFRLSTATVSADEAAARVTLRAGEKVGAVRKVVWSGLQVGSEPGLRPAWAIEVYTDPGDGHLRTVWIDGEDGSLLGEVPRALRSLKRAVWDLRNYYRADRCDNWNDTSGCEWCTGGPVELCTCPDGPFEAGCQSKIWRYSEESGCVGDGDPAGEEDCGPDAQTLWRDAARAYEYWQSAFGRNSWDGLGGYILSRANASEPWFAGVALRWDPDHDGRPDAAWISTAPGAAAPQLDGHELGHLLQYGTMELEWSSFHNQGIDVMEHLADTHSFRYRSQPFSPGYRCGIPDLQHYTQFASAHAGQGNKFIGDCHGWLVSHDGPPIVHHGIKVGGIDPELYDQIWYRALDVYLSGSHSYFDWWNLFIRAAYDLYGYSAPFYTAMLARDAIGGWSDYAPVTSAVRVGDRYPAVSWQGAPRGPCVFWRRPASSEKIFFQCYTPTGWTDPAVLNDTGLDPAASEPSAAARVEAPGQTRIYVFYQGTDHRIRYRRLDPETLTVDGPYDLGSDHRAAGVPVVAPIRTPTGSDRLVIAYHPLAHPQWVYSAHLDGPVGRVAPHADDLGTAFDTKLALSVVSYPNRERVYLFRADGAGSASPYQMRYASYTVADGWTKLADLTQHYNQLPDGPGDVLHMPSNIVRSDRGVALAVYGRTEPRLRMTFVTLGHELWYATLREVTPGVLSREGYRAVPLATCGSAMTSAGGLAAGVNGTVLWHILARGKPSPKLYSHATYSD